MPWHSRAALLAALSLVLAASVAAQSGSGSTVTCLDSQYLDSDECVNYKNQGVKASTDFDQEIDSGNT
ncbi:hypothetical protein BBO99_00009228, partial [Phytophthora kernoviae]